MESVFDPEQKLTIAGREFTFRPLVYRQYKQFLASVPKVLQEVARIKPDLFDGTERSDKEILKELPPVLFAVGPALLDRILELVAWSLRDDKGKDVKTSWLSDNLKMVDFSGLLCKFFEANDVGGIIGNFRKIGSALGKIPSPKPISSPNSEQNTHGPAPSISSTD